MKDTVTKTLLQRTPNMSLGERIALLVRRAAG
jgi:hypothetical protein